MAINVSFLPSHRRFHGGNYGFNLFGRTTRRLWYNLDDAEWIQDTLGLDGCQIAIRLDFLRCSPEGKILFEERRYYVTSLDPSRVSANGLLRLIRGHWQVENCLHFVKDRWWDEDRHWTSRPGLAAVLASLTNAAISVLRLWPDTEPILRAKTEKVQWNPTNASKVLGL